MRRWLPSDMVGLTGVEYLHSEQGLATATPENGTTPVNTWTAIRPGGGTPTVARAFRDDFRPYLSTVNGRQSVLFDAATRQLNLDTANLPAGRNDKFWFIATKNLEVRSGDYYPFGYGGGSGSAVTWKMRRGQVPYSDIGTFGFNVGSAPIAASGISIITEAYRQSSTLTRSWYNGQAEPSTFVRERNTSASNARLGHWSTYGNGSNQHLLRLGWGYGEPTVDDILRLQGWLSWDTGDDGASLLDGHPYKAAPPMFDDGAAAGVNGSASITLGALTGIGAAVLGVAAFAAVTLGSIGATGAGQSAIAGSAAVVLDRVGVSGAGAAPVSAIGAAALGPVMVQAAGSAPIGATASVDLDAIGIEAAAAVPAGAAAQISLGSIDAAASGRLPVGGAMIIALDGIGVSATATTAAIVTREASGSITLDAIGVSGSASAASRGAAAVTLGAIGTTGQGRVQIQGQAGVTLGPVQAVGVGRSAASIEAKPSYVVRMPAVQRIVRMPRVQRVIILRKGSPMLTWPRLRPGAVMNLGGDWSDQLAAGDTIISCDFKTVGGVVSAEERGLVAGVHTLKVTAIRPGVGSVVMTAATAAGETLIETVHITVD